MKLFILFAMLSVPAFADKEANVNEIKSKMMSNIDERIALLNTHKSCLQSASTREAIKACRQSHKDSMRKHKESRIQEMREMRNRMKEERKKK